MYQFNRTQLATLFKKNLSTIDAWVRQGMPFIEKGRKGQDWAFDLADVIRWKERKFQEESEKLERVELDEAKRRKVAAEAALLELELQEKRRQMLTRCDVEQSLTNAYLTMKQRLRTIPERIVPQLMGEKEEQIAHELLINEIDDALLELSQLDFNAAPSE